MKPKSKSKYGKQDAKQRDLESTKRSNADTGANPVIPISKSHVMSDDGLNQDRQAGKGNPLQEDLGTRKSKSSVVPPTVDNSKDASQPVLSLKQKSKSVNRWTEQAGNNSKDKILRYKTPQPALSNPPSDVIKDKEILSIYGDLLPKEHYSRLEVARLIHITMQGVTQGFMKFTKEQDVTHEKIVAETKHKMFSNMEYNGEIINELKKQITNLKEQIKSQEELKKQWLDKANLVNAHLQLKKDIAKAKKEIDLKIKECIKYQEDRTHEKQSRINASIEEMIWKETKQILEKLK